MGLPRSDSEAILHWATERSVLARSFPLDAEQHLEELRGLDLLVIDGDHEPLLAVAECDRLKLKVSSLVVALLAHGNPVLEVATMRALVHTASSAERERRGYSVGDIATPAVPRASGRTLDRSQ
jgi:hypothetical protein